MHDYYLKVSPHLCAEAYLHEEFRVGRHFGAQAQFNEPLYARPACTVVMPSPCYDR